MSRELLLPILEELCQISQQLDQLWREDFKEDSEVDELRAQYLLEQRDELIILLKKYWNKFDIGQEILLLRWQELLHWQQQLELVIERRWEQGRNQLHSHESIAQKVKQVAKFSSGRSAHEY